MKAIHLRDEGGCRPATHKMRMRGLPRRTADTSSAETGQAWLRFPVVHHLRPNIRFRPCIASCATVEIVAETPSAMVIGAEMPQ
jgi:hypothetical protein